MTIWRAAIIATLTFTAVVGTAGPAMAGGSWLYPVRDRYEAGERVTIVGYTSSADLSRGPYYAFLDVDPSETPDVVPLGPFEPLHIEETDYWMGRGLRASVSFALPDDVGPGRHEIYLCSDPCETAGLGDFVGAEVYVGVDPPEPIVRDWPHDDPAVAELADDAYLTRSLGGRPITAGEVRELETDRGEPLPGVASAAPEDERTAVRTDREPTTTDVGGVVPWLVAFAVLLGAWLVAWRLGASYKGAHRSENGQEGAHQQASTVRL